MPVGRVLSGRERVAYRATMPGVSNANRAALYDCQGYTAALAILGDTNLFQAPLGAAGVFNGAAIVKTLLQTNLRTPGQLPAGQELSCWDIRVQADVNLYNSETTATILTNAVRAVHDYLMGSFMVVQMDGKVILEISPLAILSAGYGPQASGYGSANITAGAAAGGGALLLTNGSPNRSGLWNLSPIPLMFTAGHVFQVTITTPITVTLPANTSMNVWVHLDGVLNRAA